MNVKNDSILDNLNSEIDELLDALFPICRSITGNGVRQTLSKLTQITNFDIKEIPSGTICYDWTIPDEWNIHDAYVEDMSGKKIIDFKENNIHLVSYSIPIDKIISFEELKKHLHTLPDLPNAIPYRTSYYEKNWGFCLSAEQYSQLDYDSNYHVVIDSTLKPGHLTYGEYCIKGTSGKEFLISTYCDHPSLANDNLSGIILWILLLRELKSRKTYHSYRFVIAPETIGAIAYLWKNEVIMKKVYAGLITTSVAGPGQLSYKQSFLAEHEIDKISISCLKETNEDYIVYPFDIIGSDETEFSAPYFRIPIGLICKDKFHEFDYYHTSLDNLDFITSENLHKTFKLYLQIIDKLEMNKTFISLCPQCEPMLSKRGLYPTSGGGIKQSVVDSKTSHYEREYDFKTEYIKKGIELDAMMWLFFYGDGTHSLFDISEITKISMSILHHVAEILCTKKLLKLKL